MDFFLPNTRPHAGGQGVYISKSLKFGGEVIPRIKTVTDTLFLAIQGGNIKVHTLFFWKIKPSGWQTCLAEKSRFGIHAHSHAHCAEELELGFFHPFLILPDYVYDLKKSNHKDTAPWWGWGKWKHPPEKVTTVRMREMETSLWVSSGCLRTRPQNWCFISSSAPPKSHQSLGTAEYHTQHFSIALCHLSPVSENFISSSSPSSGQKRREQEHVINDLLPQNLYVYVIEALVHKKVLPKRLRSLTDHHSVPRATVSPLVWHSSWWHMWWKLSAQLWLVHVTYIHCPHSLRAWGAGEL